MTYYLIGGGALLLAWLKSRTTAGSSATPASMISDNLPESTLELQQQEEIVSLENTSEPESGGAPAPGGGSYAPIGALPGPPIGAINSLSPSNFGHDYAVNDVVTISSGNDNATAKVTAVQDFYGGVHNAIAGLVLLTGGTGYFVAQGVQLSGGSGSGASVNILSVS